MKLLFKLVLFASVFLRQPSAWAWNGSGHMTIGAIAYQELKQTDPIAAERVIEILQANPEFETLWKYKLAKVDTAEREQLLFMLAATWSDDIRQDDRYDHPKWHYINLPYRPNSEPDSVTTNEPDSKNILTALAQNLDILTSDADLEEQSIALCWIFHLVGDVHQPLHTTALFTEKFPQGDRGGTQFYIKVKPENQTTISLHRFWDELLGSSTDDRTIRDRATRLRLVYDLSRDDLPKIQKIDFDNWAKVESFTLAKHIAYLNGNLLGSTDEDDGAILPPDYSDRAIIVAQKQVILAGYRLAKLLEQLY